MCIEVRLLLQHRDALSRSSVLRGSCASGHCGTLRISCNVECCSSVIPYHLVLRTAISPVYTTIDALPWARGNVIAPVKRYCGNESHAARYCFLKWPSHLVPKRSQPWANILKIATGTTMAINQRRIDFASRILSPPLLRGLR